VPSPTPPPVTHYENFPVASLLCPKPLRPAVAAIYHFARTADDLADEGELEAGERLLALHRYRRALELATAPAPYPADGDWPDVMPPLQHAVRQHDLPAALLHDLLTAFERDILHSEAVAVYPRHDDLIDYARYSANPVGRLMLHLYGVRSEPALRQSDAICTALQLFNFWQDISVDVSRGRYYLPQDLADRHGVDCRDPMHAPAAQRAALLQELLERARGLMSQGAALPEAVAGIAGRKAAWELRLVMQGGLRIGEKTAKLGAEAFSKRPRIGAMDGLLMLARSLQPLR
jgi:squalene synthase HpnC